VTEGNFRSKRSTCNRQLAGELLIIALSLSHCCEQNYFPDFQHCSGKSKIREHHAIHFGQIDSRCLIEKSDSADRNI
jgi:hypothetical protein